jgi:NADPH:quinone reductase-like Zn-dependent oxidoreductase
MQAIVMHETGGPEVLRMEEVDPPAPGEGEVLLAVHTASVNPIDWKFRRGVIPKALPAILGVDVCGVVQESRAEGFSAGDPVFGFATSGAYAQLAITPAGAIASKPQGLSEEQAGALPVAGTTAWQALFDSGGLQEGQTVVIAGASGGVGHLAVQLASAAGARTVGIGSARNREFVLGLGAADYVDYTSEDVRDLLSDADLAFDAVGGGTGAQLLSTVRPGGRLVSIVAGSIPEDQAAARGVRAEQLTSKPDPGLLAALADRAAAGALNVELAETLPLAETARAHELSESGRTRGKIVLSVGR